MRVVRLFNRIQAEEDQLQRKLLRLHSSQTHRMYDERRALDVHDIIMQLFWLHEDKFNAYNALDAIAIQIGAVDRDDFKCKCHGLSWPDHCAQEKEELESILIFWGRIHQHWIYDFKIGNIHLMPLFADDWPKLLHFMQGAREMMLKNFHQAYTPGKWESLRFAEIHGIDKLAEAIKIFHPYSNDASVSTEPPSVCGIDACTFFQRNVMSLVEDIFGKNICSTAYRELYKRSPLKETLHAVRKLLTSESERDWDVFLNQVSIDIAHSFAVELQDICNHTTIPVNPDVNELCSRFPDLQEKIEAAKRLRSIRTMEAVFPFYDGTYSDATVSRLNDAMEKLEFVNESSGNHFERAFRKDIMHKVVEICGLQVLISACQIVSRPIKVTHLLEQVENFVPKPGLWEQLVAELRNRSFHKLLGGELNSVCGENVYPLRQIFWQLKLREELCERFPAKKEEINEAWTCFSKYQVVLVYVSRSS